MPEWPNGSKRFVIDEDDILTAEKCIAQANDQYTKADFKSTRFEGRLYLYKSGLLYRKCQKSFNELDNAFLGTGKASSTSNKDIKTIESLLEETLDTINLCVKTLEHTSLYDINVAQKFQTYLKSYVLRISKELKRKIPLIFNDNIPKDDQHSLSSSSRLATSQDEGFEFLEELKNV